MKATYFNNIIRYLNLIVFKYFSIFDKNIHILFKKN